MELAKLKLLFGTGDLVAADAVESPLESSKSNRKWNLLITRRSGAKTILRLKDGKTARVFNSLDAVHSTAMTVGFRQLTVTS